MDPVKLFDAPIDGIGKINQEINKLNCLIEQYNSLSGKQKIEILMQIHLQLTDLHQRYGNSTDSLLREDRANKESALEYSKFYQGVRGQVQQELQQWGCADFSAKGVELWEIEANKDNELSFSVGSLDEQSNSDFIRNALDLVKKLEFSDKKASELTEPEVIKSYKQLRQLKISIRQFMISQECTPKDREKLTHLLAHINHQAFELINSNPKVKAELFPSSDSKLINHLNSLSYDQIKRMGDDLNSNALEGIFPGHSVNFLGGANAKNYLITNDETSEQFVLRVNPNMGNTTQTSERLKETTFNNSLAAVHFSYPAIAGEVMYGIELTEYFHRGDLLSIGVKSQKNIQLLTDDIDSKSDSELILKKDPNLDVKKQKLAQLKNEHLSNTLNYYLQMADIYLDLQKNEALFPDSKPTNILVNDENKLVITDKKSLISTRNGKTFLHENPNEECLQTTRQFYSPDLTWAEKRAVDAEKEHAYLMGLSLYCYFTGTDPAVNPLPWPKDHAKFLNFEHEAFNTIHQGNNLKELIKSLTLTSETSTEKRMTIQEAKEHLSIILQRKVLYRVASNDYTPLFAPSLAADNTLVFTELDNEASNPRSRQLLTKFDIQLELLKEQSMALHARGHLSAAKEAEKLYNVLVTKRNHFIIEKPTQANKEKFAETCGGSIDTALEGELKEARGGRIKKILFNIAKALNYLIGQDKLTGSITKINDIKDSLKSMRADEENYTPRP